MAKRYFLGKGLRKLGRPAKALAPSPALMGKTPPSPESDPTPLPLSLSEALTIPASDANLPAVVEKAALPSKPNYKLPATSKLKKQVVRILALRTRGYSLAEVGEAMGLSPNTVRGYLYRAGRNGWLEDMDDPRDRIEHDVLHKVVRNMSEALDSADESRRDDMTIKVAQGTIFKTFDQSAQAAQPNVLALALKIEHVQGAITEVRQGAIHGKPAFVDAEVVDAL